MVAFEWRAGLGLFAQVTWTDRARAHIAANEYRYISPVILFDAKGQVTGLHNAALVSTPAILGMDAVTAALAAAAVPTQGTTLPRHPTTDPQESRMDLAILITMLGLAATAGVPDVTAALQALINRPALPVALCTQLGLQASADEAAALAALSKKLTTPDAGTLAAMAALQAQVATLTSQVVERQVTEAIEAAITVGKMTEALRPWALSFGRKDMAGLTAYLAAAPAIQGLAGQTGGRAAGAADTPATVLTPAQAMLAAQLGIDPKAYLAQLNLQAA